MDVLSELEGEENRAGENRDAVLSLVAGLVQIDDSELPQSIKNMFIICEQCETT
jgi:hypothetical protein